MSHLSIFEPAWIDLVFEGRNKEYGAYQLRRENSKTTIKAFFIALTAVTAVISIPLYMGAKTTTVPRITTYTLSPSVHLIDAIHHPKADPPKKATVVPPAKSEVPKPKPTLANATVAKTENATTDITPNADLPATTSPTGNSTSTGTGTTGTDSSGTATMDSPVSGEGPESTAVYKSVDKLPQYPGGIDKFYLYVGRNFRAAEEELASGTIIRVVVSFVVEKDGTMTDIKVLQNPGYGMDKEAIRVLKSLKIKWEPGKVKGNPVRTAYSLPISVKAP